jgi:hypothetical protein
MKIQMFKRKGHVLFTFPTTAYFYRFLSKIISKVNDGKKPLK